MSDSDRGQKPGWWGSTLSKLKGALARTKSAVVDNVLERDGAVDDAAAPDETPASAREEITEERDQGVIQVDAQPASGGPCAIPTTPPPFPDIEPLPAPEPPRPAVATIPSTRTQAPEREIDDDYLEDLEEKLIKADLGLKTAESMVLHLRKLARASNWTSRNVEGFLRKEFSEILKTSRDHGLKYQPGKLNLYLIVGVNGTGKTTSIGKLCWRFKSEGKKVLVAAADTFRAAAESQLEIWAKRADVDIVRLSDGSDPGAVVFQALRKAKDENYDVVVIDTAGRLHNKTDLMAELKKIRGVIEKHGAGLPLEAMLVLDASTGQNGLQQAKVFTEVCPLTGVILTKLDGTAKGGVVFAIASELKIPVKLIGLGEQIDDLRDFEPDLFVEALFS